MLKNKKFQLATIILLWAAVVMVVAPVIVSLTQDEREVIADQHLIVQKFDSNGQITDYTESDLITITEYPNYTLQTADEKTAKKMPALEVKARGQKMIQVGYNAQLVAYEPSLLNLYTIFQETLKEEAFDPAVPFTNRMVNELQDLTVGAGKIVVIRAASGQIIAAFAGNEITYIELESDILTGMLIDGQILYIGGYEFTIYDTAYLNTI